MHACLKQCPFTGVAIEPVAGMALRFEHILPDGSYNTATWHDGCNVISGSKIILQKFKELPASKRRPGDSGVYTVDSGAFSPPTDVCRLACGLLLLMAGAGAGAGVAFCARLLSTSQECIKDRYCRRLAIALGIPLVAMMMMVVGA